MAQIVEKLAKMANDPSSDYFYLPITDAKKLINLTVNLFAKVSAIGLPCKTKGTDFCLVLRIVDTSSAQEVSVNFFTNEKGCLPMVKAPGDIICLHQVEMKIHGADANFLFNKSFSSFALFDGKTVGKLNPYQTSKNFKATECATELLEQLRKLSFKKFDEAGRYEVNSGAPTRLTLLKNIEVGKFYDLVCKVIHVREITEGEWVLYIWDGTDAPPMSFQANLDLELEKPSPLYHEPLPSRETLCLFPCVGTILRVTTGKFFEDIERLPVDGHWVKLYNVSCELHSEIWTGVMDSSSRVFILSDEDSNVKYRKRVYGERDASNRGRVPLSTSLDAPKTEYEDVSYATLMDSITNSEVEHRLKCVVRIVGSLPWRGEDLRCPVDGHYRVRLTLEDPTARVHAYISHEEAVNFFGGNLEPVDLTRKMMKLLGIDEPEDEGSVPASRNPPWIECCVMSYNLDENDPWSSRRYRIYDTRLLY